MGRIAIGGENPVRIQSMTTTNTNDTEACVAQAERIIKAGGELVRLTTQGIREAENLQNISKGIRNDGFATPLVADVHFNPMSILHDASSSTITPTRNTHRNCRK